MKNFKYIIAILFLILLFFLSACFPMPGKDQIWEAAKSEVESNLLSSTKKTFPDYKEKYVVEIRKGQYKVEAYVIEENSSCCDPIKRTFFKCIVEFSRGKFTVNNLEFGNSENWMKPKY